MLARLDTENCVGTICWGPLMRLMHLSLRILTRVPLLKRKKSTREEAHAFWRQNKRIRCQSLFGVLNRFLLISSFLQDYLPAHAFKSLMIDKKKVNDNSLWMVGQCRSWSLKSENLLQVLNVFYIYCLCVKQWIFNMTFWSGSSS